MMIARRFKNSADHTFGKREWKCIVTGSSLENLADACRSKPRHDFACALHRRSARWQTKPLRIIVYPFW